MLKTLNITLFTLAIVVLIGGWLLKSTVAREYDRLSTLQKDIITSTEELHMTQAEWSYRAQPSRIQAISQDHLGLSPMAADQLTTLPTFSRPEQIAQ